MKNERLRGIERYLNGGAYKDWEAITPELLIAIVEELQAIKELLTPKK